MQWLGVLRDEAYRNAERERWTRSGALPRELRLLDGLFGLGRDGVRLVGLVHFVGDALHAVLEATKSFAEALAELRQLLAAEENEHDDCENDKMRG